APPDLLEDDATPCDRPRVRPPHEVAPGTIVRPADGSTITRALDRCGGGYCSNHATRYTSDDTGGHAADNTAGDALSSVERLRRRDREGEQRDEYCRTKDKPPSGRPCVDFENGH